MDGDSLAGCVTCVVIIAVIAVLIPIVGSVLGVVNGVIAFFGDVVAAISNFVTVSGTVVVGSIITICVLTVIGSIVKSLNPEKERQYQSEKKKKQAEAENKAKKGAGERTEAERRDELVAQQNAKREARQKAEDECIAGLAKQERLERERERKVSDRIVSAVEASIEAAGNAVIMDAGIGSLPGSSVDERELASIVSQRAIENSKAARNYERAGITDAAQIAAIEYAGTNAIDYAVKAATLCKSLSTESRQDCFKRARLSALKSALHKSGFEGNMSSESLDGIVSKADKTHTTTIRQAQVVAKARASARIATDRNTNSKGSAASAARVEAVTYVMSVATSLPDVLLRMLLIGVDTAFSITDAIEKAVITGYTGHPEYRRNDKAKTKSKDEKITDILWSWKTIKGYEAIVKDSLTHSVPVEIQRISRAARHYIPPGTMNVPVSDYRSLPKFTSPAGYVYVIQEVEFSKLYKIGRTNDPATRSSFVDLKTPGETQVVAILKADDDRALESYLHKKYAKARKQGEWFDLTDEQVREICSL